MSLAVEKLWDLISCHTSLIHVNPKHLSNHMSAIIGATEFMVSDRTGRVALLLAPNADVVIVQHNEAFLGLEPGQI